MMTNDELKRLQHVEAKLDELEARIKQICTALALENEKRFVVPEEIEIAQSIKKQVLWKGEKYVREFLAHRKYQELENQMRILREDFPSVGVQNGS